MGTAIAKVQKEGVPITLPVINDADFGFKPDIPNDRIIFGLKGINSINTELAQAIINNRPYSSMEDFAEKMLVAHEIVEENGEIFTIPSIIKKSQMLQLIKAGCFTELHNQDRAETMRWFLQNYVFSPAEKLGLNQLGKITELEIIPSKVELAYKMTNFKKYVLSDGNLVEKHIDPDKKMVKRGYHDGYYLLDENSQPFFNEHFTEDSVIRVQGQYYVVSEKKFIKEVDSYIQPLKDWLSDPSTIELYNQRLFEQVWKDYASGSKEHWNMQALTYYEIGKHELENIDEDTYGIVNYFDLPEEPEPYEWYTRYIGGQPKKIPKFKISCIAGAVVNADNGHHTVTLVTKYGPVNVKVNKGKYSYYNKRISEMGEDGKKHVIEESWFKRGTLLRICGIKRDDQFWPMNYTDTIYTHTINLITEVHEDGTLLMQYERYKPE